MLMYFECYVHFFNVLKLMSYDNEDAWMMFYNLMKNCEYVVYDDIWCYAYYYIIHVSQYMLWWIFSPLCYCCCCFILWCLCSWGTDSQDEHL